MACHERGQVIDVSQSLVECRAVDVGDSRLQLASGPASARRRRERCAFACVAPRREALGFGTPSGIEQWQQCRGDLNVDRPRHLRNPRDQPLPLERQYHLMNGRWRHTEVPLQLRLGGGAGVQSAIGVNERQILPLPHCEVCHVGENGRPAGATEGGAAPFRARPVAFAARSSELSPAVNNDSDPDTVWCKCPDHNGRLTHKQAHVTAACGLELGEAAAPSRKIAAVRDREAANPFGEIRRDRQRCPTKPVGEEEVPARKTTCRRARCVGEVNAVLIHEKLLERKRHARTLASVRQQSSEQRGERRKETEEHGVLAHSPSRPPKLWVSFLLSVSLLSISARCADRNRDGGI